MPDYRKSNLVSFRKKDKLEAAPIRLGQALGVQGHRREKGKSDAKQTINDIYDTKLF